MANINWRINHGATSSTGSQPISGTYTQSGTSEITINQNFPSNTTKQQVNSVSFGAPGNSSGNLQAVILLASQNMIVYTNNANAPQDTIALTAGIPLEWDNSLIFPCPFNNSVSTIFVTCNTSGLLQGSILKY